jgi:ABC-type transport system involved in cytochrome bd biosynthesis fused ATPase/permease subunit
MLSASNWIQLALSAPIIAIITVVIKGLFDSRAGRNTNKVSEQEANTHEFTAIINGFKESLKAVSDRVEDQNEQIQELQTKVKSLEETKAELESERQMYLSHIAMLETMIPNPPGPPIRPIPRKKTK